MMSVEVKNLKGVQVYFSGLTQRLKKPSRAMNTVAQIGLKNVMKHFDDEQGPNRKWARWNKKINGKRVFFSSRPTKRGGNKLLQDTGTLRGANRGKGLNNEAWIYNRTSYAKFHQDGTKKMVKRAFLWIDNITRRKIVTFFKKYMVE